ncbi:MAG: radical SAM protein, partial [Candidatus Aminicenantes bacterium]
AEQKDLWSSHFTVISGGEPLIYKSEGRDIFDLFADHPDTFFLMYTNGTLIDANTAKKLAEVGNVTPAISVEGFEEETDRRRGQGVFKKILHAMENLRQEGVPFGISITAMRHNAELILSEEFIDFYFNKQGALYGWIFQYMPIGRRFTLDLQVTPQQRKWMLEKTWSYIHEQNLFLADFWNCGAVSNGCISAGKPGGYLYIDWNGNVMPCVFNPYTLDNIITIYNQGGNLNQVLLSPLFTRIREWQEKYALQGPPDKMGNILRPCVIRDHYQIMRQIIDETKAKPADEPAAQALQDKDYYVGLLAYDKELQRELDPLWEKNYLKPEKRQQAYA